MDTFKIAAIGDVHGHLDEMKELLGLVSEHDPDFIVFLGDYVDRGPDTRGVINEIRSILGPGLTSGSAVVFLKGNHEDMLIQAAHGRMDPSMWLSNGGDKVFKQYTGTLDPSLLSPQELSEKMKLLQEDADFLDNLPLTVQTEKHIFVHAGIPISDIDFDDPRLQDQFLWYRGKQPKWRGKRVVHGHTPVKRVLITEDEINVDTGCGFGLSLSAVIIDEDANTEVVVSIPAKRR